MRRVLRHLWQRALRHPAPACLQSKIARLDDGIITALEGFRG
jgi:hypothetical protein